METKPPVPRAILVGIQLDGVDDVAHEASLSELGRLVETLGYEVAGSVSQKRDGIGGLTVLGKGKLAELAAITAGPGRWGWTAPQKSKSRARFENAEVPAPGQRRTVAVVRNSSSSIMRYHESGAQPGERHRRAGSRPDGCDRRDLPSPCRSREAKLQVEMARLKYVAPRLRESASGSERRRGVGAGESDLDLDRRNIRDRLAELKEQLDHVQRDSEQRRTARRDQLRVALVGYTNAGKSSLMRALTGSEVLVADQLFATLDTTVRALKPEAKPRVLVSDTVGFIKQLPHDLVASFKSTLDEALEASLLLFVVDASDPTYEAQLEVSRSPCCGKSAQMSYPSRLCSSTRSTGLDDEAARAASDRQASGCDPDCQRSRRTDVAALPRDHHRVLRGLHDRGRACAALRQARAARRRFTRGRGCCPRITTPLAGY